METPELPPDLERLERLLAERERPEPSPDLKDRVVAKMEAASRPKQLPSQCPNGWWAFLATAAASVVFLFNVSSSAARATSYDLRLAAASKSIEPSLQQIQELIPELSHREARRHALTIQAGSTLARCPDITSSAATRRLSDLNDYFSEGD
jgi:hypothetical protein